MTQPPAPDATARPSINTVVSGLSNPTPTELAAALNGPGMRGALPETMGIELIEAHPDKVVGRMPIAGNTQPYGILHGGATVVLAAALHGGLDSVAMGIDVGCTHHRSPRGDYVIGTATPLHRGRTVASYLIDVVDETGTRIATARLTCVLRPVG
jgi:1,4-dihydroxy-2-naphthoyl-CoA hydrolase